jgi:mannitol/fructose-specific phosphotransferase system IIA component (Ntr-type)
MKFASLVQSNNVLTNTKSDSAEDAIRAIVAHIQESGDFKLPENALDMILERERSYPTGIGESVAIPHTNCLDLEETFIAVGFFPEGVPFGGPGGSAKLVILLLNPPGNINLHLKMLARISRLARSGVVKNIPADASPEVLMACLAEAEKEFLEL